MYCTTFPCHNCAKHIIAAGIDRVVYIEPYDKSKAFEFHSESIDADALHDVHKSKPKIRDNVKFEPFVGIGPRKFFDVFSMKLSSGYELKRKDKLGNKFDWSIEKSKLRLLMKPSHYLELEDEAAHSFESVCL